MSNYTAQRILDTAQTLIVERGYNGFSYADISEVVKVSKASIHFHFATKAVLVEQLVRRYRADVLGNLAQLSARVAPAPQRLEHYAAHWEHCIRTNTSPYCMGAMLASELPTLPDEVQVEVRAFFQDMQGWLAGTINDGVGQGALVAARDVALEAKAFLAAVHGAMLDARVFGDAAMFAAVVGEAIGRLRQQ